MGIMTKQQIKNNVYQFITKCYVETLHHIPLYMPDASSLRDFVNSDEQKVLQVRMINGDVWTGLIKVQQVLENTLSMTDSLSEGHYTILTLEYLLLVSGTFSLNT